MTTRKYYSRPVQSRWELARESFRKSRAESGYMIEAERASIREPGATAVEKLTGRGVVIGQWLMQWPVAIIAGGEQLVKPRQKPTLFQ